MGLRITLIAFFVGLGFLGLVLRQVRRTRISPAATTLWLFVALFLVSISVLESVYKWLAVYVIGITDARHVIYVAVIGFLMIYVFYLTSVITLMNDQIQNLISYHAILEAKLNRLANGSAVSSWPEARTQPTLTASDCAQQGRSTPAVGSGV